MADHLNKFMPNLTETTKSLCDLLSNKNHWTWNAAQQTGFEKIKQSLSSSPVFATCIYDPNQVTTVAANALSYNLSAVLSQIYTVRWLMVTSCICIASFNIHRRALHSK